MTPDNELYYKDELLKLYGRSVMIFTAGSCSLVLNIIEPEIKLYLLHVEREPLLEKDYKIRWDESIKHIAVFKANASWGDRAEVSFHYSGMVLV